MSTPPGLIDASQFPYRSITMDLVGLESAATSLRRLGSGVEGGASTLVGTWSGLVPAYQGPADERVHALMGPVEGSAGYLAADLTTAAGHLDELAAALVPLKSSMAELEERADQFRTEVAAGVEVPAAHAADAGLFGAGWETVVVPWNQDTGTVARNEALLLEHAKLVEDISTATADCHNALMNLVAGADEADDVAPVAAEQLMDRRVEYPWGAPVTEDRNWAESINHGAYSFGANLLAGAAALAVGYDAQMEERSNEYWGQAWTGLGNALMSLAVSGATSALAGASPGVAGALGHLPPGAQQWLADRHVVARTTMADLVGVDYADHLAGGDGLWRWREDAIATGTESALNIGSMFVPSGGGVAAGALRTGSLGARLLRITTGAVDVVIPGTSLAVHGGIRVTTGLRTAVLRLDELHPVGLRPDTADAAPSTSALDDPHVIREQPLSDELFSPADAAPGADGVLEDIGYVDGGADPAGLSQLQPVDGPADTTSSSVVVDRHDYATSISRQRQYRHLLDSGLHDIDDGYFTDAADAQSVLDAFHDGSAEVLGFKSNGDPVIRVEGVSGFHNNHGAGYHDQLTDVFFIKGTRRVSVVPYTPNWTPTAS